MNLQENINRIKQMMGIKSNKPTFKQHEHLIEIFSNSYDELDENIENENSRDDVIQKINNNDFENDPESFLEAINNTKKHKEMLSDYSIEDFSNMKLFKVNGYDIGYALKKSKDGEYNEIVSVFNNSDVKGVGDELIKSAIKNGGCYLDHYDGFLSDFYSRHDFEEYDRYEFNPQYDPEGKFERKYGRRDIIFRKHKDC